MAPTILDLAGITAPNNLDGRSLKPILQGNIASDWRTSFLIEYNSDIVFPHLKNMGYKAIRTERWKYIRYNEQAGSNQLYDLRSDPYEMRNIIGEPSGQNIIFDLDREIDEILAKTP